MRSAALIAEDIAARGGGVADVLDALRFAADSIEYGWHGAACMGYVAGYLWDEGLEDALCTLDEIRNLIKNRKTVSVEKIKEALSES